VFTSVGITIPISGRLEIEKQRAGVEHAAELARVAQREWSVRIAVRRAWSEWSALDAQLAATREFLSRVDQILVVVDKMEQAGEMARTEARLFRIEKATKASDLATLESRAREAELRLRQLMGMSPDAPLRFQAAGIGPTRASTTANADAAELERRSPAMLVAAAEYEAAEKALELEVRKQYPDLHIGPGYGNEDGQNQVLLGLSVPIPILNANRQGIAEARARRELAQAGAETTLEQTIAAMRAAEVRLAAATRRRQTLETEVVPLVDAQYSDARQVARLGEVNTLVLLESLTRQQEAKIGLVEAARDEAIAASDVDELVGPPLSLPGVPTGTTQPSNATPASDPSTTNPPATGSAPR
jgi:CRISPR system Cascade subunit CasA